MNKLFPMSSMISATLLGSFLFAYSVQTESVLMQVSVAAFTATTAYIKYKQFNEGLAL